MVAKIQTGSQEAAYALYLRQLADDIHNDTNYSPNTELMLRDVADYLEDLLE